MDKGRVIKYLLQVAEDIGRGHQNFSVFYNGPQEIFAAFEWATKILSADPTKSFKIIFYAVNDMGEGLCCFCEDNHWVGHPCNRIPKPYPNHAANKFKYLSVFKTPVANREVDDYQPRRNARLWYEKGDLETNEGFEQFSKTIAITWII